MPETPTPIDANELAAIVRRALAEDVGRGDVTSQWTLPPGLLGSGVFLCKAPGILAGMAVACEVLAQVSADVRLDAVRSDGDPIAPGERFAAVTGPMADILTAERTALNFMQRMSGIATATRRYVNAVAGTRAGILDTRKTAPGLRLLDKWAMRLGGGQNHRLRLDDMVLIKDNHIAAAGGITAAVERVRAQNAPGLPIEVEVKTWAELEEAVALRPDRIMLDNMTPDQMRRAVEWVSDRVPLEASGGIDLGTVRAVAETGVDYISVGALTHSVTALDISLEVSQPISRLIDIH
ncbi:MAG: carboxylating nicotinate-nucleotide diphosphorylase [Chloroflexi bacterium]|nr:carboxylating nicotinate-nucleotide diphosphorylase [Chloroflexota bacterium]MBU1751998.1 carboxylating nicotinate-nucleotide diphosphorylase [Chloroflexota bacterium]